MLIIVPLVDILLYLLEIVVIIGVIVWLIWIGLWPMVVIFGGCLLLFTFIESFNLKD